MRLLLAPRPSLIDRHAFVQAYGSIYERSPWVAEQVATAGLQPADDEPAYLAHRMAQIVDAAGVDRQLALLRAHPELVGRIGLAQDMTHESTREQAGAGLDQCSPDEFQRFHDLNHAYGARFGFPFIIAVAGLDRAAILASFGQRIHHDRDTEFQTALAQVHRIARFRLDRMAVPTEP
jgi:OHCU decarboxylase